MDRLDHAGRRRGDRVLHLHRLEHDERGAALDPIADLHRDGDDRARHRRGQVPGMRRFLARVRERVDMAQPAAHAGCEHVPFLAMAHDAHVDLVAPVVDPPAIAMARGAHRRALAVDLDRQRVKRPRQPRLDRGFAVGERERDRMARAVGPPCVGRPPGRMRIRNDGLGARSRELVDRGRGERDGGRAAGRREERRVVLLDQAGVELAGRERVVRDDALEEGDVGRRRRRPRSRPSAASSVARARSRSSPQTISFASIGS
jgi:hypothetical protein